MLDEKEFTEAVKNMRRRTKKMEHEGDYWTAEEREKLARLFDDGIGLTEIAILLQRTEPAVSQQVEKLDLYQRKENPARRRDPDKSPVCLCGNCKLDCAFCPRCNPCTATQEGI